MGLISNDYRCAEDGWLVEDHISERDEEVDIPCPVCGETLKKVPAFAAMAKEWPGYVQTEAMNALDPQHDAAAYKAARNGDLHRDDWNKIMKEKGYRRTDASELEQDAKRRKFLKKNKGDPVVNERNRKKLIEAFREKKAVSVSTKKAPVAAAA
jgi:hypothetical protein